MKSQSHNFPLTIQDIDEVRLESRYVVFESRLAREPIERRVEGVDGAEERVKDGIAFGVELQ